MNLQDLFAACYVINLPARTDRRRAAEQELAAAGLDGGGWAEFFPAIRPESAGPFATVGSRGCFLSHLAVLRDAAARRLRNVLVMEDDLALSPGLVKDPARLLVPLASRRWDIAYLGHLLGDDPAATETFRAHTGPIMTTHFLAFNGPCVPRVIAFLEAVLSRPEGHPDGGPMDVDGAYTTFREQTPDVVTLVASRSLGGQRSSRSDIRPNRADRTPGLRTLAALARAARERFRPSWVGGAK